MYEGVKVPEKGSVGLITYMRTDSTRISGEARKVAKKEIEIWKHNNLSKEEILRIVEEVYRDRD